jgi:hypothetical protein
VYLHDLVAAVFQTGGVGAVRLRSSQPFLASSRTYNSGDGTSGTFGQLVPGLSADQALQTGILLQVANDPAPSGFRSNLGLLNPGLTTATVGYKVYDVGSATLLGEGSRTLLPLAFLQVNDLFGSIGAGATVAPNATVEVTASRPVFTYASVLDNTSGDALFVLPYPDSGTPIGSNRPPTGTIVSPVGDLTVQAGQAVSFLGAADDPDGDAVTVLWSFGDGTTSEVLAPGDHTYAGAGTYTVTFTATDAHALADPAPPSRTITVNPGTVTTAADDTFSAAAQVPLSIPAAGVLGNDIGADGNPLTASLASGPTDPNGSVALGADGSFVYTYATGVAAPAADSFTYRAVDGVGEGAVATVRISVVPAANLTDIRVSYRLDPWLISGNYGGGFWVSPPVLGPVVQSGNVFVLEVRADGLNDGIPVSVSPTWVPADPGMVTVTPSHAHQVTITVRHAGQSDLHVVSQGVRTTLAITAEDYQGSALRVVISRL